MKQQKDEFHLASFQLSRRGGRLRLACVSHALASISYRKNPTSANEATRGRAMCAVGSLEDAVEDGFNSNLLDTNTWIPDANVISAITKALMSPESQFQSYRQKCIFESNTRDLLFTYMLFLKKLYAMPVEETDSWYRNATACLYAAANLGDWLDS